MFEIDKLAGAVIASQSGAYISKHFRLDTVNYSWVKDYRRDQIIRDEIKDLQQKIQDTEKMPMHKDELRARFNLIIDQVNKFRIDQMTDLLSRLQKGEPGAYNESAIGVYKILGAPYLPYFMKFAPSEIDDILSKLPEGVKQQDKEKNISKYRNKITELEDVITKELSPQSRWLHRDNGEPIKYPTGCRWKAFVDVWSKVQSRYDSPVNIDGTPLSTEGEYMAHAILKLDTILKMPPLKKAVA